MHRARPRMGCLLTLMGLVVVGLTVSSYLPLPSPVLAFRPPGAFTVVSVTLTPARQVSLVVALLACAAVDSLMRGDRRLARAGLARTAPFWVLPALSLLGAFALYERLTAPRQQALGLVAAALFTGLLAILQLHTLDPRDRWFGPARLGLNAVVYTLALAAYLLAHTIPARSVVAAPLIALISALLALELLESRNSSARRIWGSAALVGLMMAEVAWALGPGVLPPLQAGALLLLVFYGLTGVLQQHLWGRLRPRVALEFLAVGVLALALLLRA